MPPADEARAAIFGVTCGNDVSERNWQHGPGKDLQWWRAKGCDTFAPLGPAIVTGLDYGNLLLETRLNGEVGAEAVHLRPDFRLPGDRELDQRLGHPHARRHYLTGTPGSTRKMSPGDVVEVEIEGGRGVAQSGEVAHHGDTEPQRRGGWVGGAAPSLERAQS